MFHMIYTNLSQMQQLFDVSIKRNALFSTILCKKFFLRGRGRDNMGVAIGRCAAIDVVRSTELTRYAQGRVKQSSRWRHLSAKQQRSCERHCKCYERVPLSAGHCVCVCVCVCACMYILVCTFITICKHITANS
jgi:hypothetical protein